MTFFGYAIVAVVSFAIGVAGTAYAILIWW
jgi:hypothetical protein